MSILTQARKDLKLTLANPNDFGVEVNFSRLGNTYNFISQFGSIDIDYDSETGQYLQNNKVHCAVRVQDVIDHSLSLDALRTNNNWIVTATLSDNITSNYTINDKYIDNTLGVVVFTLSVVK